ncbi:uncharacterized protein LOC114722734 isoform X2 [Neltuma alba]|uniref:uncharacterized protein LOC114722663 isoform X2 n=1 Tax=Neltuma alba TaxID=207710 RepID=UPI0010A3661D|nr:uncharacterized protein LOC114722663 isoform X2 [Prosopis alba]XP_028764664.1 uncharacterized protein LOC114722734 isoform X2 [Prosopis alba]
MELEGGGRKLAAIITKGGRRRRRRIEASSIAYMSSTRERKKKHAQNKASSNHTQDLNHQQEEAESSSSFPDDLPTVRVETLDKGFRVNVFSEKNCPAMLVSVLEAFEQLGLDVLDARASCEDTFQFEAVSEEKEIDAQTVKQTVLQAINSAMD